MEVGLGRWNGSGNREVNGSGIGEVKLNLGEVATMLTDDRCV